MQRLTHLLVALIVAALPFSAAGYSALYVFGDSLSDTGNNAIVFNLNAGGARTPTPIPDTRFVPTFPYVNSAPIPGQTLDRYSNGVTWTELFAQAIGEPLGARPSLALNNNFADGANFAFGGALTGGSAPFPLSLTNQVGSYLLGSAGRADPDALYVVAGGGNNARAAVDAIRAGANINTTIASFAAQYAADVGGMVSALSGAGARNIVVWNTPDLGLAPGYLGTPLAQIGTGVAAGMNQVMQSLVWTQPGVTGFDLFGLLGSVATDPARFGLTNVTIGCASLQSGCNPNTFLFWDAIHPTSAGHNIIAQAMLRRVPEPTALILLAIAGVGLLVIRKLRR